MGQLLALPLRGAAHVARPLLATLRPAARLLHLSAQPSAAGSAAAPALLTPHGNTAPPVVHAILDAASLKPGRLVIVGDIHGCVDELSRLLEEHSVGANDNLVLVGDLVRRK